MTSIWVHATGDPHNRDAVLGHTVKDVSLFFTSYAISILATSLGMTKMLQVGPCPVLSEKGWLGGLLKCRFIVAYMATMFSLLTKAVFIGMITGWVLIFRRHESEIELFAYFLLCLLPNVLFAFINIVRSTGCKKSFAKIVLGYPGLWLLPVATYFTIGPRRVFCCSSKPSDHQEHELGFSKHLTCVNLILTLISYAITITIFLYRYKFDDEILYIVFPAAFVSVLIIGILFTITFLSLEQSGCSCSLGCCCTCSCKCCTLCCSPSFFEFNYHYIRINRETNELQIGQRDE